MHVAVIDTGGTISCLGEPLAPMPAERFAAAVDRLLAQAVRRRFADSTFTHVTDLTFPAAAAGSLDSTDLRPSDWCLIAETILRDYDRYDGWIVLHGTDTMAYTGAALSFLLSSFDARGRPTALLDKPVVLTGSQVPLFGEADDGELALRYGTDAFENLCAAIAGVHERLPEVTVAFRGRLFRGNRVLKTHANAYDAFDSPDVAPLASIGMEVSVDPGIVRTPPGDDTPRLAAPATRAQGAVARALRTASRVGVLVLNSTQVLAGSVAGPTYAAGAWLASAGAISTHDMTPVAAVAKASVLLAEADWEGNDWTEETPRHLIGLNLTGELHADVP